MRGMLVTTVILGMTGCSAEQVEFSHTAKVESQSRGVVMLDDAQHANIGMLGNTCMVDVNTGAIPVDVDVAQGEEDFVADGFDGHTLVVGTGGVFQIDDGTYFTGGASDGGVGVTAARFTVDGVVSVRDGFGDCTVAFPDGSEVGVAGPCAEASVAVDRTGTLFVANSAGVSAVRPDGAVQLAAGDLVAWDEAADQVYASARGATEVTAMGDDGAVRWTMPVDGEVISMDDMGNMGAVGVMTRVEDGGQFLILDGETGAVVTSLMTPAGDPAVVVAPDARSMAFVLENEVHFLAINLR